MTKRKSVHFVPLDHRDIPGSFAAIRRMVDAAEADLEKHPTTRQCARCGYRRRLDAVRFFKGIYNCIDERACARRRRSRTRR